MRPACVLRAPAAPIPRPADLAPPDPPPAVPPPAYLQSLGPDAAAAARPGLGRRPYSLELFLQLNDYEIRKGKKIGVTVSFNNHRLFVGNIPKNRDRDDLFEEFSKHARKSLSNS